MRKQVFSRDLLFLIGPFSFLSAAFGLTKTIIDIIPGNKRSIVFFVTVMTKDEKLSTIHSSPVQFAILR